MKSTVASVARPVAADGWPLSGLCTIHELIAVSGLSRSKLYDLIRSGELKTKIFGRARRVPWSEARRVFLD